MFLLLIISGIKSDQAEVACEPNQDDNKFHCIFEDVDFTNDSTWSLSNRKDLEVNKNVTGFTVRRSNLYYIPIVIFKVFPSLRTFYAFEENFNLKLINARDFKGARNLVNLYLHKNEITKLTANNFKEIPNLVDLFLNSNQIKVIEDATFAGLHKLLTLYLDHNQLETISFNTFKGLFSLTYLELSHNKIKSIENRSFRMVKKFLFFNIAENECIAVFNESDEEYDLKEIYEDCDPKKLLLSVEVL